MRAVYDQGSQAALAPITPRIDFNALHLKGIFINPFERGEIGPDLFRAACQMGLEGLVSKRRDPPYQAGRSKHWIKVKNRKHPAMSRVMEAFG